MKTPFSLFLNLKIFAATFLILLSFTSAHGKGKLDISIGQFSFDAKTRTATVSKSNIGTYELDYRYPLNNFIEFGVGYSLLMTQTVSGDMSFGPNFEALLYPLSLPAKVLFTDDNSTLMINEKLRPFIGGSFHQRQFQSIQNSYAGFGFFFGTDYVVSPLLALKIEYRMISLNGPDNSSGTQNDLMVGYILEF